MMKENPDELTAEERELDKSISDLLNKMLEEGDERLEELDYLRIAFTQELIKDKIYVSDNQRYIESNKKFLGVLESTPDYRDLYKFLQECGSRKQRHNQQKKLSNQINEFLEKADTSDPKYGQDYQSLNNIRNALLFNEMFKGRSPDEAIVNADMRLINQLKNNSKNSKLLQVIFD